jgi:PKHD-type hydroxylase
MEANPNQKRTHPASTLFRAWPSVFPAAVCDEVIAAFNDYEFSAAGVQTPGGAPTVRSDRRAASHLYIDPEHWAGSLITHFAHQANLLWRRDVSGLGTLSIVRYDEGGHFMWHIDDVAYGAQKYPGLGPQLDRKVSVSVNLSDPDDYDGGDLEFRNGLGAPAAGPDIRPRGSVVVFPSNVGHRVTPVTRGSRFALIGWMVGPRLR